MTVLYDTAHRSPLTDVSEVRTASITRAINKLSEKVYWKYRNRLNQMRPCHKYGEYVTIRRGNWPIWVVERKLRVSARGLINRGRFMS
jgi:hypothetical protein